MASEKKRRGKKITSSIELLGREPYRTIIEIIYHFEESEPQQIRCAINNGDEEKLKLGHIHNYLGDGRWVKSQEEYKRKTRDIKQLIQSRPDKPRYHLTPFNLRDYLNTLIKWGIVEKTGIPEKKERGKYQLTNSFKKEFARESNKKIINGYPGSAITDIAREYGITLYGLGGLIKQLEKADISDFKEFAPDQLKHLKGEDYINDIGDNILKINDGLLQFSNDIKDAKDYLLNVSLLRRILQTKDAAIRDFFIQHRKELLGFKFSIIFSLSDPSRITKYLSQNEAETVKDYLKLNGKQKNAVKTLVNEYDKSSLISPNSFRRKFLLLPFTLFYSDIKHSPSPLTIEVALRESRIDAIMNDNTLSFVEKKQLVENLRKEIYPEFDDTQGYEWEKLCQEMNEKIKVVMTKYDDDVGPGDVPEVSVLKKKYKEKLVIQCLEIEKRIEEG